MENLEAFTAPSHAYLSGQLSKCEFQNSLITHLTLATSSQLTKLAYALIVLSEAPQKDSSE